jgi:major membrane immunogen (membrane-anchored lipoprotein)
MASMTENRGIALLFGTLCLAGAVALAQEPPLNISSAKHPHLAAAQQEARHAWDKLVEAQKANDWDMQGNAQKAKDMLVQVNQQLKAAADAANTNGANKKSGGPTGQPPAANISAQRHPHLAAAQQLSRQAWQKMVEAQQANDWDMEGHAQHAKEMLVQVMKDLKAAALAANAGAHH